VLKVRKTPLLAIMAAGVLSFCFVVLQGLAQQPGPARPPVAPAAVNGFAGKTVLLDVNYVFKKHARFKQAMDLLKNDADAMDVQMKKEEGQLRNLAMGLQKLNPGSPEYKKMEEDIARANTDWKIKVQQQRREFLMREAKTYSDTYKEIEDEVNYFCQANGIVLVLRFMGDPVEEGNPDSILANINKPVVWYDKNLDITPYILKRFAGPDRPATQADQRNNPPYNGNAGGLAPGGVPAAPFKR
jgi:Skp family chaperone for outer membrane proteins